VKPNNLLGWLRHLIFTRGVHVSYTQMLRMYHYHRTPFQIILQNIFNILEKYEAKFTFSIVASIAKQELIEAIMNSGHEIASHSLYHVKHKGLSFETQFHYISKSLTVLSNYGADIQGFRAPYNSYDDNTFRCLNKVNITYDAGVRRGESYRKILQPFHVMVDDVESRFVSFPVFDTSDESLDDLPEQIVLKSFIEHINNLPENGLSVLQLHPIRIGQKKYLQFLNKLVSHITTLGFEMPTLTEVVNKKCTKPAICLTGDIDCLSFYDYLKRI
jgi:peptidoglycan/xylan/chitin deacetylase (PgdA/CDA1 family)